MADYNAMELMICVAARNLENGATVVVGTGAPCAAAMLSQKTHSPNLTIMFEAGGVAPIRLERDRFCYPGLPEALPVCYRLPD